MSDDQQQQGDGTLIRDADGTFKVWKDGVLIPVEQIERGIRFSGGASSAFVPPQASAVHEEEDEREIQALRERMGGIVSSASHVEEKAAQVIREANIRLDNPELGKRLTTLVVARLRDLRDDAETRAMLGRPIIQGGLGFDTVSVEKIMRSIKSALTGVQSPRKEEVPLPQSSPPSPKLSPPPLPPPPPSPPPPRPATPSVSIPPPRAAEERPRPLVTPAGKPKVTDVLEPHLLTGPVEELRYRLVDFRRLGKPEDAVQKIEEKLRLLETESYADRISGILAWQSSEVYDLYLTITEESLTVARPIAEVIRKRSEERKPTLAPDEYRAVNSLSQRLAF